MNNEDLNGDLTELLHGFSEPEKKEVGNASSFSSPSVASQLGRREFLQWMGAVTALLTSDACLRPPGEKILPYTNQPEEVIPGKPLFFATAHPFRGTGIGILAESHTGRPTKIEGNPTHPSSLGATDAITQACLLTLYDPDRSKEVKSQGKPSTWEAFSEALLKHAPQLKASSGAGLRILAEPTSSPSLLDLRKKILAQYPKAKWVQYDPVNRDHALDAAKMVFDKEVTTHYHFKNAKVVLSLDADFLTSGIESVRYARDFMSQRGALASENSSHMSRLYVIETSSTNTGALSDHVLRIKPSQFEKIMFALANNLGLSTPMLGGLTKEQGTWLSSLVQDLTKYKGESLVIVGDEAPLQIHALAHAINFLLGNVGHTVSYSAPIVLTEGTRLSDFKMLVSEMNRSAIDLLVILNVNPVFSSPGDIGFTEALSKVALSVHLGLYEDETAERSTWHIPQAHFLESWGDIRSSDGTVSVIQPLIAPLYQGKSAEEVLNLLRGQATQTVYESLRVYWRSHLLKTGTLDFEGAWRKSLNDGVIAGTAEPVLSVSPHPVNQWLKVKNINTKAEETANELEIVFRPDPTIWDGSFANNAWLQELPKPMTKLTWDNALCLHPTTATALNLKHGELVELSLKNKTVTLPIFLLPTQCEGVGLVHFGYGRQKAGRVGSGIGVNVYPIRFSDAMWVSHDSKIKPLHRQYPLASPRDHFNLNNEHRSIARSVLFDEFVKDREVLLKEREKEIPPDFMAPDIPSNLKQYAWGMSINLSSCTGCNACVMACQSENNIPVVGKEEVLRGREMHWLRVDRYFPEPSKEKSHSEVHAMFQPVPCMHCETAPCEYVCPVEATPHSEEGINQMVYNRCVGTRYCSNNCPYKVRRFNFFQYSDQKTPSLKLLNNPDVTVRSRGVMEKCTYCIQRINAVRIQATVEGRSIQDGEVVTACQQVCPTQAISFGNIKDPKATVSILKQSPLNYAMLEELNTRPRTTYLAQLKNPNQTMESV